MYKKIGKLILVIIWMIVIFMFSNDNSIESSKKSDGLIINSIQVVMNRKLTVKETETVLKYLVTPVRKCAHFFLYFILGILIISICREFFPINYKILLLASLIFLLYAISDEIHQLFVPGRSGEIKDILIDYLGSLTGTFCYYKIYFKVMKRGKYE